MLNSLIADGEVAAAVADVSSGVTGIIPTALAIGATVVAALVGWRVAKRFFA